jgi:hypothetical protein
MAAGCQSYGPVRFLVAWSEMFGMVGVWWGSAVLMMLLIWMYT